MREDMFEGKGIMIPRKIMIIIAWVLFGITAISSITYFGYYEYDFDYNVYKFSLAVPSIMDFLFFLLNISSIGLLAIYITFFHGNKKMSVFIPIVFGIIATTPVLSLIQRCIYGFYGFFSVINFLASIPFCVFCVLVMISMLRNETKKSIIIIALAIGLFIESMSFISFLTDLNYYIRNTLALGIFNLGMMGDVGLYLLLFFLTTGSITEIKSSSASSAKAPYQQALINLNAAWREGRISEEEYLKRRDIIVENMNSL